ncbi:hypothetical protein THAOC_37064 [Thalassiosira oceanica]|uniref:Periplasmic copper-binding protein NosD beta helix domain-containing protein n=1 Tax=Thalassiosira oceanica TaxID=159749 RepID=K0RCZ4_THAOC|nr:hypothetical protein THAOC_37064 [Thalassiosira oceanica]|eukprot:EJK44397.1 hypothetical protein THAOC_37064 [Thalassiosira oceanica]
MSDSGPGNQVGIRVKGDNNVLSNNYISVRKDLADNYWTKTIGVRSFGNDCLIIGNTISDGSDGIFIEDANSLVVSGNSIQNCGVVAIHLKDSSHVTVEDNTLVDSKWGVLSSNATSLAIRIRDMKRDGIELSNAASSSISGNSINNCGDPAISLHDPSNITVEKNTLLESRQGSIK